MALTLKSSVITIATAGTPVALSAGTPSFTVSEQQVAAVTVTAALDASGNVYVSGEDVDASNKVGQPITAGESVQLEPPTYYGTGELIDLSTIYVDSTANGDTVSVTIYVREK